MRPAGVVGRNARPEEGLAGVDVAEAGHHPAVEKEALDRPAPSPGGAAQVPGVEVVGEGLHPEVAEPWAALQLAGGEDLEESEAPGVGVDQGRPRVEGEDDVVVEEPPAAAEDQVSRHPEMDEERAPGGELQQQELGPPPGAGETLPRQGAHPGPGEGLAQAQAAGPCAGDGAAHEVGGHGAADGLDFGQLGHGGLSGRVMVPGPRVAGKAGILTFAGSPTKHQWRPSLAWT